MDQYFSFTIDKKADIKFAFISWESHDGKSSQDFVISWYDGDTFMTSSFKDFFESVEFAISKLQEKKI